MVALLLYYICTTAMGDCACAMAALRCIKPVHYGITMPSLNCMLYAVTMIALGCHYTCYEMWGVIISLRLPFNAVAIVLSCRALRLHYDNKYSIAFCDCFVHALHLYLTKRCMYHGCTTIILLYSSYCSPL